MKTQHTPGQWQMEFCLDQSVFVNANDTIIAMLQGEEDEGISDRVVANARLIAAAPDLLEALLEALDQLETWNPESEDTFTIKRVKQAIQKAI